MELTNVVKGYIAASLDFDSYGMLHVLAGEAIDKFQLNVELDIKYLNEF